jgi:hypothetical protein
MSTYLDSFAHDLFPDERSLQAFTMVDHPVLALLEQRVHTVSGKTWSYPALVQSAHAMSTDRAAVQEIAQQANDVGNFMGEEFTLGYFPPGYKAGFEISDFDMALTESAGGVPDGAYMESFAIKLKGINSEFGARQERYFIGKSGKSLARTTANGGTTDFSAGTVTLEDPLMIGAFRIGQILNASVNDGSGAHALLGSGTDQKIYVRFIDEDSGVLYVSATSGGSLGHSAMNTAASTNQVYLFNLRDFQGTSGYTPNVMPPGVQDWIPSSWTTGIGTFYGVDRGQQSKLAGFRLPTTGNNGIAGKQLDGVIELALERAYQLFGVSGEYTVLAAPRRWTQLTQIAKTRGYRILDGETAILGYKYIEIVHGSMRAKVVSVPAMSTDDLFFLKMENDGWCVRSLGGGWPRIMNGDGLKMLRYSNDDKYEYRIVSYFHFGVRGINQNGRANISSLSAAA